jgi:NTP pyrophosphatase (non-canonical NTP hydrolase)
VTFEEYEVFTHEVAIYPYAGSNLVYPALGLAGEAGEVADHIKKYMRDDDWVLSDARREKVLYELGDVLYYLARMAIEADLTLEQVAQSNIDKLRQRKAQDKLKGEGSTR